ncbi:MAG: hypothetical protein KC441_07775 [Anaerolineales bacterium]|nr:hypothetical protein [Anaerolineales bacterium]
MPIHKATLAKIGDWRLPFKICALENKICALEKNFSALEFDRFRLGKNSLPGAPETSGRSFQFAAGLCIISGAA